MLDPPHETNNADELKRLLREDGIIGDTATLTPLSGGISSEIYLVCNQGMQFVVKRALPKLKVPEEWFADVSRNRNEANYLRYAGAFRPRNVPRLDYANAEHGYFCMEYLGEGWENWKSQLLKQHLDPEIAVAAADFLGTVHAHSAGDPVVKTTFDTLKEFEQLRIEPYLLATARRHPDLAPVILAAADRLRACHDVLVHGDFSPKNILVGASGIVVVDCEVAWCGDAAFDIAFLLNHLLLKSLLSPFHKMTFHLMFASAWSSYLNARFAGAQHADIVKLEQHAGEMLLLLLLARVDSKSPVEYLSEPQRDWIRAFVIPRLHALPLAVEQVGEEWFKTLQQSSLQNVESIA